MKAGANFRDVNEIKRMAEDGATAEEISYRLQIEEDCVKSFMPKKRGRPKSEEKAEE